MSDFKRCLSLVLQAETSYVQPSDGTPYVRHTDGSTRPPAHPDGLAFDDDPRDTGGRTCMGLRQDEYDAWRKTRGLPVRDVWGIEDSEISEIYCTQYWNAAHCGTMPAAIALCVFDTAVGCGVGMGVKLLQRALGVPADGHYGLITQAALQNADIPQTAIKLIAARETYHRACPTFPAFGKGWLARDAATRHEALALCPAVDTPPAAAAVPDTDIPDYSDVAQDSRRAPVPVPPDTVTETKTGRSAAVKAGILGGFGLHQLLELYDGAQRNGLLAPEHLMPVAAIIACVTGLAFCRRDIIDRAFKLIQGV